MGNQQTTTSDSVNDVNPSMKSIESNKSSAASASLSKGTTMLNEDTAKIGGSSIQISDSNTLIPVNDLKPGTIEVVSVVGHKKVLTGVKTKVLVLLMVRTGPSNKEVDGNKGYIVSSYVEFLFLLRRNARIRPTLSPGHPVRSRGDPDGTVGRTGQSTPAGPPRHFQRSITE